jgi:hypothetical protein
MINAADAVRDSLDPIAAAIALVISATAGALIFFVLGWTFAPIYIIIWRLSKGTSEALVKENIRNRKFPVFSRRFLFPERKLTAELEKNRKETETQIAVAMKKEFEAGEKLRVILGTIKKSLTRSANEASVLIQ